MRVSLSQGMEWGGTISLKAWIAAGPSPFEAGLSLLRIRQSHHVSEVLSLDPGYLSMRTFSLRARSRSLHETRGIFLPKHSCPISLQIACIELVRCHTNMQLGNIGFTCQFVGGF